MLPGLTIKADRAESLATQSNRRIPPVRGSDPSDVTCLT